MYKRLEPNQIMLLYSGIKASMGGIGGIKDSTGYYLNEGEMNEIGNQFLLQKELKEAVAIFKLNTQAFPKSSKVYDSYGKALMAIGNKTEAIENYKKSVKLNPGNEGGIKCSYYSRNKIIRFLYCTLQQV